MLRLHPFVPSLAITRGPDACAAAGALLGTKTIKTT